MTDRKKRQPDYTVGKKVWKRKATSDQLIKLFSQVVRDMSSMSFRHAIFLENLYGQYLFLLQKSRICVQHNKELRQIYEVFHRLKFHLRNFSGGISNI